MNKLYIVRHGQTNWNAQKLLQGQTDIELNEEGIRQAKEVSKVIDLDKMDICICSPLKRTRKTAELIVGDILYMINYYFKEIMVIMKVNQLYLI